MNPDIYDLGAMDDDEIIGAMNEKTIDSAIAAMVKINDGLYSALSSYKAAVTLGRWTSPVGLLLYSADDVGHAEWEVENWHTGALKWMTEGAKGVREGTIKPEDWGDLGVRFSESAKEIASKLADVGLATRAKQFASTMPESFRKVVHGAAKGAGSIVGPILGEIPWWVWGIAGTIGAIALLNAFSGAARSVRGIVED